MCELAVGRPKRVRWLFKCRNAPPVGDQISRISPCLRSEEVFDVVAEEREVLRELVPILGLKRRLYLKHELLKGSAVWDGECGCGSKG